MLLSSDSGGKAGAAKNTCTGLCWAFGAGGEGNESRFSTERSELAPYTPIKPISLQSHYCYIAFGKYVIFKFTF